jgi:hypothetical protein
MKEIWSGDIRNNTIRICKGKCIHPESGKNSSCITIEKFSSDSWIDAGKIFKTNEKEFSEEEILEVVASIKEQLN